MLRTTLVGRPEVPRARQDRDPGRQRPCIAWDGNGSRTGGFHSNEIRGLQVPGSCYNHGTRCWASSCNPFRAVYHLIISRLEAQAAGELVINERGSARSPPTIQQRQAPPPHHITASGHCSRRHAIPVSFPYPIPPGACQSKTMGCSTLQLARLYEAR